MPLAGAELPANAVLVFGGEGPGLSEELRSAADGMVMIEQFGSTRSVNVGVAAGIVMYEWLRQHVL
jgi:tRNA G18 (ribose-2'-O)-methylase SpoU